MQKDFNPSCHDGTHCADPPGKLSFQARSFSHQTGTGVEAAAAAPGEGTSLLPVTSSRGGAAGGDSAGGGGSSGGGGGGGGGDGVGSSTHQYSYLYGY